MAKADATKDLFTASEVARFCQVDLKTIHNWADRGEIEHFRTPGRHLRFRRADVLDFLRRYGYPIPDVLMQGKPKVVVLCTDRSRAGEVEGALAEAFDVTTASEPVAALVALGAAPPDVAVLTDRCGTLDPVEVVAALVAEAGTRHVRSVIYAADSELEARGKDAGAFAFVHAGEMEKLRSTLEALVGLRR